MQHELHDLLDQIPPVYKPHIVACDNIQIYYGGSGSGKSYFIAKKLLFHTFSNKHFRAIYIRKIGGLLRGSCFLLFCDIIKHHNLEKYFHILSNSMTITNVLTGNQLLAYGLDDPEKIKSVQEPTAIWVEEMSEIDEKDFTELMRRLRGDANTKLMFIGTLNPIYKARWIKDMVERTPTAFSMKTTYKDNPYIDQEAYLANIRLTQSDNDILVYEHGGWGNNIIGNAYYNFHASLISDVKYNPKSTLYLSFDFNVVPYQTCTVYQVEAVGNSKYVLKCIDELCLKAPMNNTVSMSRAIAEKYSMQENTIMIYGDYSGANRGGMGMEYNGETIDHHYQVIEQIVGTIGVRLVNDIRPNENIIKRRDFMRAIFSNEINITFAVSPDCEKLIMDLRECQFDKDGKKMKKIVTDKITQESYQELGHTSDSLEYAVCGIFNDFYETYKTQLKK